MRKMRQIRLLIGSTSAIAALALAASVPLSAYGQAPQPSTTVKDDVLVARTADAKADTATPKDMTAPNRTGESPKAPEPVVMVPASWNGFYAGIYIGVGFGHARAQTSTVFSPTGYFASSSVPAIAAVGNQEITPTGFDGGFSLGVDHEVSSNIVIGAEGDFGPLRFNETVVASGTYPCCAPTGFTVSQRIRTNWLLMLRGRGGVKVASNGLIYGIGGLATTRIIYTEQFTDTFAHAFQNGGVRASKSGWTVGGGAEWRFPGTHWSIKGEYAYASFGRVSGTSSNLQADGTPRVAFPSNVFSFTTKLHSHFVRGGVNYRF